MKAALINETGPPNVLQIGEIADPVPEPGQVLVRVTAVAVNPIDTYIRSGTVALPLEFPYIPGCDLAGTVEACGTAVDGFQVGDRVWGSNQGLFGRQGSFAEQTAVDQEWLYHTPDGLTDADAAAGALVGITAHLGLFLHASLQPGETVFVNGGSGGVGSSVIQLAKAASAVVITTAGNEPNREYCRQIGADLVLDYRSADLEDALREFSEPRGGIHVWFETQRQPTLERSVALMAPRGRLVLMAGRDARPEFPVGPFYVKDLRTVGFAMFNASADEQRTAAEAINRLAADGLWKPKIGAVMPLSDVAAAHQLQEDNTLGLQGTLSGKIVLKP